MKFNDQSWHCHSIGVGTLVEHCLACAKRPRQREAIAPDMREASTPECPGDTQWWGMSAMSGGLAVVAAQRSRPTIPLFVTSRVITFEGNFPNLSPNYLNFLACANVYRVRMLT